ncbi:MAG TPA: rod shape-determining protein MreD [Acidimicrobiia bacterium]|nr:rod shape-determining protein MreD [Acidimicrobiia bacterium]
MTSQQFSRGLIVLVVVLLAQLTVVLDLRVDGAHPDIVLGLAIVAGLVGGVERGAVVGFVSGASLDLFLPTPFGLSALVGTVIGAAAGALVTSRIDRSNPLFLPGVAVIGSVIGVIMFAVLGTVLGQPDMVTVSLAPVVGVVALVNGLACYPLRRACAWALGQSEGRSAWRGPLVSGDAP